MRTFEKWLMFALLMFWHISATGYFGWNYLPESGDEILCDGLFVIGMILIFK